MTREHKLGIAVTCTFLCLTGSVIGLKMQQPPPTAASAAEGEGSASTIPPAAPAAPPVRNRITNKDMADKMAPVSSPAGPMKSDKEKKDSEKQPAFDPNLALVKSPPSPSPVDKAAAKQEKARPSPSPEPLSFSMTPPAPIVRGEEKKQPPPAEKNNAEKDKKTAIKPFAPFADNTPSASPAPKPADSNIRPAGVVLPPVNSDGKNPPAGQVRPLDKSTPPTANPAARPEKSEPELSFIPGGSTPPPAPARPAPATTPPGAGGNGGTMTPLSPPPNNPPAPPPPAAQSPMPPPASSSLPPLQPVKRTPGETVTPPPPGANLSPLAPKAEDNKVPPSPPPALKADWPPMGAKTDDKKPAPVAPPSPPPPPPAPTDKTPANGSYFVPDSHTSTNPPGGNGKSAPAPLPYPSMPGGASTSAAPTPRPAPQVIVYDEQDYVCQPGDTFEKISARFYQSEAFAQALRRHNRQHARASGEMASKGTITQGERVFIPPADILEQRYGDAVVKPGSPTPPQTLPASFVPPGGSPPPTGGAPFTPGK